MPLANCALVVGIDVYPGIRPLKGAEADAQEFYRWVIGDGGVKEQNAKLVVTSNFQPPARHVDEALPAKHLIEAFFTSVHNAAEFNNTAGLGTKAGGRLYMFFAGHGFAPALDKSGILMANATLDAPHNISATLWADRLYEGGWFDEVLLFQDACRERIADADLMPPFLRRRQRPLNPPGARFYAFAAKNRQLAKELSLGSRVGGVFTDTLMEGLRDGKARDPATGEITTRQLKEFLQANMKRRLPPEDLDDDEIAKIPEFFDPDPSFVIVDAATAAVPEFSVKVALSQPGGPAHIEGGSLAEPLTKDPSPAIWDLMLRRGIYKLTVEGQGSVLFEVTGAPEVVNVRL